MIVVEAMDIAMAKGDAVIVAGLGCMLGAKVGTIVKIGIAFTGTAGGGRRGVVFEGGG